MQKDYYYCYYFLLMFLSLLIVLEFLSKMNKMLKKIMINYFCEQAVAEMFQRYLNRSRNWMQLQQRREVEDYCFHHFDDSVDEFSEKFFANHTL